MSDNQNNQKSQNKIIKKVKDLKTRDKIIVISLIVFILLGLIALIYNITLLVSTNNRNRQLQQQIYEINRQIEGLQNEQDFRNSPEFIEDFARRYLEMHRDGESLFGGR